MISNPSSVQQPSLNISTDFLSKYQVDSSVFLTGTRTTAAKSSVGSSSLSSDESVPLPEGYRPSDYDCIMGRGKGSYNKPGNRRMRRIVRDAVPEYQRAKTKYDKSAVLLAVVDRVKDQNDGAAMFVAPKQGRWYRVSDDKAREKVGHCMRETIALLSAEQEEGSKNDRAVRKQQFDDKRDDLLERQRAAFDSLVSSALQSVGGSSSSSSSSTGRSSQFQQARREQQQLQQPEQWLPPMEITTSTFTAV